MAKKKKTTTTTTTNYDIVKFCAFWGLVIAAIAAILSFIFALLQKCGVVITWAGRVVGICNTVSQLALIIAAFIPAYRYSRGKSTGWKVLFWIAVVFVILGLVGINLAF